MRTKTGQRHDRTAFLDKEISVVPNATLANPYMPIMGAKSQPMPTSSKSLGETCITLAGKVTNARKAKPSPKFKNVRELLGM